MRIEQLGIGIGGQVRQPPPPPNHHSGFDWWSAVWTGPPPLDHSNLYKNNKGTASHRAGWLENKLGVLGVFGRFRLIVRF